jgi:cytoskeletal protein RodZ
MKATLGEVLRSERERRGITLEQVYSATRIQLKILHALESDDYEELPAKPFIRGFVKTYARFIGLNEVELLTQYKSFIDEQVRGRGQRSGGSKGYVFDRSEGDGGRTGLWVAMGSFLLLGSIGFWVLKPNLKSHRHGHGERLKGIAASKSPHPSPYPSPYPSPEPVGSPFPQAVSPLPLLASPTPTPELRPSPVSSSPVPSGVSPSPVPAPSTSPSPVPEQSEKLEKKDPMNSGADLPASEVKTKWVLKAHERFLARFRVDDKPVSEVWVKKGKVLVLRARQRIVVQVSNAEAVGLSTRGKSVDSLEQASPDLFSRKGSLFYSGKGQGLESVEKTFEGLPGLPKTPGVPQPVASSSPEV